MKIRIKYNDDDLRFGLHDLIKTSKLYSTMYDCFLSTFNNVMILSLFEYFFFLIIFRHLNRKDPSMVLDLQLIPMIKDTYMVGRIIMGVVLEDLFLA